MAEEVAFSRRRNDNPRSKIHLQEREEGDARSVSLFLSRRERSTSESRGIESSRERERKRERSETDSREEGMSVRRTGRIAGRAERELNYVLISRPFRKRASRDAIHQISGAIYILNWRLLATRLRGVPVVGADTDYKKRPRAAANLYEKSWSRAITRRCCECEDVVLRSCRKQLSAETETFFAFLGGSLGYEDGAG